MDNKWYASRLDVFADTDSDGPLHANKSLLCLPMDTDGVVIEKNWIK